MNGRGREHNPPHVHAYYKEDLALIDINTCEVLQGYIPNEQLKIARDFVSGNKENLLSLWEEDPQNFEGFKNGLSKN